MKKNWETLLLIHTRSCVSDVKGLATEGGWSEAEAERILKAGYAPISLGKRILRAETAAIYGAAVFAAEVER